MFENGSGGSKGPLTRRKFLAGLGIGAGLAPLAVKFGPSLIARRTNSPAICLNTPKPTLDASSDFNFLGYYDVSTNGPDAPFAQGLTHRYVGGDLRLLTLQHDPANVAFLEEISLAGKSFGSVISAPTNRWLTPWGTAQPMNGFFFGLWWEESKNRLWTTHAVDYILEYYPTQIFTRTLNSDGTVSGVRGPVSLDGIGAKRAHGGVQPVPSSFQNAYGVGPYAVGWGGYTSIVRGGGIASLGPTMYGIPDPASYPDNASIPTSAFKTIMDCSSGSTGTDWYGSGSQPSSFDRGVRLSAPVNYYDGGDPRANPSTAPVGPPIAGAQWLSPAPDGRGRITWGDSYYNTGCWIDGANKQGFLLIPSLSGGKCFYANATLNCESRVFEFHVFDPSKLGEAAAGTRAPWNVKPTSMAPFSPTGLGSVYLAGNAPVGNLGGATYDPVSKRLYVIGFGVDNWTNRIYVFSVNA